MADGRWPIERQKTHTTPPKAGILSNPPPPSIRCGRGLPLRNNAHRREVLLNGASVGLVQVALLLLQLPGLLMSLASVMARPLPPRLHHRCSARRPVALVVASSPTHRPSHRRPRRVVVGACAVRRAGARGRAKWAPRMSSEHQCCSASASTDETSARVSKNSKFQGHTRNTTRQAISSGGGSVPMRTICSSSHSHQTPRRRTYAIAWRPLCCTAATVVSSSSSHHRSHLLRLITFSTKALREWNNGPRPCAACLRCCVRVPVEASQQGGRERALCHFNIRSRQGTASWGFPVVGKATGRRRQGARWFVS